MDDLNLTYEENQRLFKIHQEIGQRLFSKMNSIKELSEKFENQIKVIGEKLTFKLRKSCSEEFRWYEQNTKVTMVDGREEIEVTNEDSIETKENMMKFQDCISRNDYGINKILFDIEKRTKSLEKESFEKQSKCIQNMNNKTDDEIKICIEDTVSYLVDKTKDIIITSSEKLLDINSKI